MKCWIGSGSGTLVPVNRYLMFIIKEEKFTFDSLMAAALTAYRAAGLQSFSNMIQEIR